MLLKVVVIIALIGACQAEHAYSSQSFIRYPHDHHDTHNEKQAIDGHKQEHHLELSNIENKDHKLEHPATGTEASEHKSEPHEHQSEHHGLEADHKLTHHEHKIEHKPTHYVTKIEHKPIHHEKITEQKTEHQEKHLENQSEHKEQNILHIPEHHEKKIDHKSEIHVTKIEHKPVHEEKKIEHNEKQHENTAEKNEKHAHHEQNVEHKSHQATEHKYEHKIQHIVEHKHHTEHKHEQPKETIIEQHKELTEKTQEQNAENKLDHHKQELHTKVVPTVVKHDEQIAIAIEPVKVVPVAEYVQKSAKGNHNEQHGHATSYQQISRHDVPAPPPKDFIDYSGSGKYEFSYEVKDPHTGDQKSQHEKHDGHNVTGAYSLHQPDGSVRTVEYSADKQAGFSANVKHSTKHVDEKKQHP